MNKKNMPDPHHFLVCEKMCPECLFTPAKIVDDARKQQIIDDCKANGSYFVCHKGSLTGNDQLCCKGFYDQVQTTITEMAKGLGVVKFVPVPKVALKHTLAIDCTENPDD